MARRNSTASPRHECSPDAVTRLKEVFYELKLELRLNYYIKFGAGQHKNCVQSFWNFFHVHKLGNNQHDDKNEIYFLITIAKIVSKGEALERVKTFTPEGRQKSTQF